ncbi:TraC family protein (plasmid) [Rhizobium sp. CB3060]|uniref:conjugal transfer protein TraC n=1 Tax=Rhizobium sp. CB3060 TaxID=3138255 RepID=UPI0021A76F9F|nr:conjugal transfer protein TraC [Rhizobium tropici]UWU26217.1 TraC family protein [Rhizobium tropici]
MKKPSSKIREEIARLQDQLKQAETREAERIGRIALKAGLGEIEIDEAELQAALEDVAKRFRGGQGGTKGTATGKKNTGDSRTSSEPSSTQQAGADAGGTGEV